MVWVLKPRRPEERRNSADKAEKACDKMRLLRVGLFSVVLGLMLASCGSPGSKPGAKVSSAAPPFDVCGHKVSVAASGPVITNLDEPSAQQSVSASHGSLLYLRLSSTCSRGSRLVVSPSSSLNLVRSVPGDDGLPVFVVGRIVAAPGTRFAISVTKDRAQLGKATIDVSA